VSTNSECDAQTVFIVGRRVSLVFDRGLIKRIAANGTSVSTDIPGPHCNGIPFSGDDI